MMTKRRRRQKNVALAAGTLGALVGLRPAFAQAGITVVPPGFSGNNTLTGSVSADDTGVSGGSCPSPHPLTLLETCEPGPVRIFFNPNGQGTQGVEIGHANPPAGSVHTVNVTAPCKDGYNNYDTWYFQTVTYTSLDTGDSLPWTDNRFQFSDVSCSGPK